MDVVIGRVVDLPAALGGQALQPQAEEILVFEEIRRGRPVERHRLRGGTDEVAGIEAVAAPFVVGLPGIGAEHQQDVTRSGLVRHHHVGDVQVAVAVGGVDEIERIVAGPPALGGDVLQHGRPAGADRRRGDLHRLLGDRDGRAAPDQFAVIARRAGRRMADAEYLDRAARELPVRPGGQHDVERLAGLDAVAVGVAPDAGAGVEAAPDRLGRRCRTGRSSRGRRRIVRRRALRPQPGHTGKHGGKDGPQQRPARYQFSPPPSCTRGAIGAVRVRDAWPRGPPARRSSQVDRTPSRRQMPYSAPTPISEP